MTHMLALRYDVDWPEAIANVHANNAGATGSNGDGHMGDEAHVKMTDNSCAALPASLHLPSSVLA